MKFSDFDWQEEYQMKNNQPNFERKSKNNKQASNWLKVVKKLYRQGSLILAALLLVVLLGLLTVVAQVFAQIPTVQSQPSGLQLVQQAKRSYEIRDFGEAARTWQQAASTFATAGDVLNQAMALSNLSLTYQQIAEWDKAEEAIAQSLDLLQTHQVKPEQLRILAQSLDIQGQLQLTTGQTETALETWQKAANTYQRLNEKDRMAQSLLNLTQAQQDLGFYPRSCKTLLQALEVKNIDCETLSKASESTPEETDSSLSTFEALPDSPIKATGLRLLGNFLRVSGNLDRSQEVLKLSLEVARKLPSPIGENEAQLSLGNTARAQLKPNKALEYYKQAATSTLSTIKVQAQLNQLSLLIENPNYLSEAQALWRQIESEITKLPINREAIYARINLAQSLICLKQQGIKNKALESSSPIIQQCNSWQEDVQGTKELFFPTIPSWLEIDEILIAAVQQAQRLKDKRAFAYALGYRGAVYQQSGDLAKAEEFTKEALGVASSIKVPDIAYRWQWQLGRLLQTQAQEKSRSQDGDRGAISAYSLAFNNLQSLRRDLVSINPDVQFNFRDSIEPLYRELADLLLRTDPTQENLKQARNVIEALQLAELDDYFREACVDAKPEEIDTVVDSAQPAAAVLYTIILKDRLGVILKLPQPNVSPEKQLLHYRHRFVSQETVESTLNKLQEYLVRDVDQANEIRKLSRSVYSWLIEPFEANLQNSQVKTLVFVLDGSLRNIPMAVLYDDKQYLVEKYATALTPGLQLIEPKPLAQVKLSALTAGISDPNEGFTKLPYVEKELKAIPAEIRRVELFNKTFTRAELQTQLNSKNFSVVHMATHGQFSSDPNETFILAWRDRLKVKDLDNLFRTRERDRSLPIELLVLSACQTARGDNRAALGLAGIAVRSGARSTLATLWPVQDESTAKLMTEFYQQLKDNPELTKAEALQRAQLALWHNKDKGWKRPFFWGAYVLVGNWL